MADEKNEKPVLGEMISQFPVEELKKAILNIYRFDYDNEPEEKPKSDEIEEKLEEVSKEIIEDNL